MTYLARCDRCKKVEEMSIRIQFAGGQIERKHDLPFGWTKTDSGDLCKKCQKEYQTFLQQFR